MHSYIRPHTHIALRLPSGIVKILEIAPNTTINIGKFGSFAANLLLGRPYYLTFELLEKDDERTKTELRVVPASELHAEALGNDHAAPAESRDDPAPTEGGVEFDIVGDDGEVIMRSNRLTIDDPSRQKLSMEEIEELKKAGTGSGKEIIERIMASHMAIEEKTSFSLAKYTLRKSRKYLKRFTVLPLDVGMLTDYLTEREAYKVMELREDTLGLVSSWANIHCSETSRVLTGEDGISQIGGGRWLVVDDTGGLVVAALAEKMGILYPSEEDDDSGSEGKEEEEEPTSATTSAQPGQIATKTPVLPEGTTAPEETSIKPEDLQNGTTEASSNLPPPDPPQDDLPQPTSNQTLSNAPPNPPRPRRPPRPHIPQMSSPTNTLTLLHSNAQPNLAHLKYFSYDSGNPSTSHPLYTHLKTISWLQILHPSEDATYAEPETISEETLATMKSSKRGNYYRKRRRWERTKSVVDETRRGGFDGLIVASVMAPQTVLRALVPLVRGGGKVVVYSANVEPLVELCDLYSKERRAAFVARQFEKPQNGVKIKREVKEEDSEPNTPLFSSYEDGDEDEDFPVNPTLLLAPSLQTARARHWQVLPGRTHPMMTSRGGAEGYLFTATRVLPVEGKVEARGHFRGKKRKTGEGSAVQV
ncbi:Gcd10p-domain-containing protein [Lophiostoma macrostomum CBS 122681]|uniref:tRNA (adenine(58)-N(1))-methyltransferase non-catalytic subunit TRM6 n=1 Tax=Lophiostoma macrostomum CBS 122681 TaxID=1314788 RepID=A0A6A6T761_9PLEO|nr:Gcd10p-domain-containing protein [Lophiostoma macrostomum CBS 122681]